MTAGISYHTWLKTVEYGLRLSHERAIVFEKAMAFDYGYDDKQEEYAYAMKTRKDCICFGSPASE